MVSTIFQSEVSVLEAQILAAQQRITLLNEAEGVTGDSLLALKTAIAKVSSLAPDAIASLKSAVLSLFTGSDDSNNGGNTPVNPAPQQGDDGDSVVAIAPQPEALTGQSCEWASPLTSPLASLLASSLCCQLEDAPSEGGSVGEASPTDTPPALTGQSVEIACVVSDAPQQEPYVELIPVTHLVAYQRRRVDGEIICCYLAGNNKSRLKDWGSWLCNQHSVGSGFELREAKRMTAYKWELKIWGMSLKQVVRLSETDTRMTPPSRYHTASIPVAAHLLQTDEVSAPYSPAQVASVTDRDVEEIPATAAKLEQEAQPDPQGFQVGDKVEITSDRHGAELVGLIGIVTAATKSGAAVDVNNTLRYFCVDELAIVSTPVSPATQEPTEEEKIAIASIQPPAYNLNPIGRAGAMANWKARQATGIGVDLKNCGTGGIKTIEEWQQIEAEQKAQKALAATASTSDDEPDF